MPQSLIAFGKIRYSGPLPVVAKEVSLGKFYKELCCHWNEGMIQDTASLTEPSIYRILLLLNLIACPLVFYVQGYDYPDCSQTIRGVPIPKLISTIKKLED